MSGVSLAIGAAGAGLAGIGALTWASLSPKTGPWGPVYSRGPVGTSSCYALTFDDGPTRQSTSQILDIVGELGVHATFFVIGANARQCPDLVARMYSEGHIVANHSLDHAHLAMFRGRRYWNRQVRETDRIIEEIIGLRPAMFRPPMGIKTWYVMGAAARQGEAVITWSLRAMDGIKTTPERILGRLVPRTMAGDVVVLHDGVEPGSRRDPMVTVEAVKPLISRLRDRGLEPAPLDHLLGLPAYAPAATTEVPA